MQEMEGVSQYRTTTLLRKDENHIKFHMGKQRCSRDCIAVQRKREKMAKRDTIKGEKRAQNKE